MAAKQKIFSNDRWMMHQHKTRDGRSGTTGTPGTAGPASTSRLAQLRQELVSTDEWHNVPLQLERKMRLDEQDEKGALDFQETFEDDEDAMEEPEDDLFGDGQKDAAGTRKAFPVRPLLGANMPSTAFELEHVTLDGLESVDEPLLQLSRSGRQLRKTLKTFDPIYQSDDDDDDDDDEDDDEEDHAEEHAPADEDNESKRRQDQSDEGHLRPDLMRGAAARLGPGKSVGSPSLASSSAIQRGSSLGTSLPTLLKSQSSPLLVGGKQVSSANPSPNPNTVSSSTGGPSGLVAPTSRRAMPKPGAPATAIKRLKIIPPVTPPLAQSASPLGAMSLRSVSSPSLSPTPSGAAGGASGTAGFSPIHLLTEQDIISELRRRPLPTKDLIALMKPKLKAHPQNKDLFRTLLKKLATVRTSDSDKSDQDRLLELKPEYR